MSLRHAYIIELVTSRIITMMYGRSNKNLIDPFIKILNADVIQQTSERNGIKTLKLNLSDGNSTLT